MKTLKELEVDFIGGGKPLTIEEEKKISDYLKSRKAKQRVSGKKRIKRDSVQQ